jgi:dTDP-4-dehydrorhamnose 3,5-epimerase
MTSRFGIIDSHIAGVKSLQRRPLADARGFFERVFCAIELREVWGSGAIVQINYSRTTVRGTVRGLHFQYPPHQEMKLVSCLRGAVFDVAVDVRAGSPTFLQWHSEVLSADNRRSLLVPQGCAHGFQTLTDDCELLYLHNAPFHADSEGGIHPLDPTLGIRWPQPFAELSQRDSSHAPLTDAFRGVTNEV